MRKDDHVNDHDDGLEAQQVSPAEDLKAGLILVQTNEANWPLHCMM